MTDWEQVLAFDTDSAEFVRGFEAGSLWARMDAEHNITATMHATNAEMVLRMAEAKGFEFRAATIDDDWLTVVLHR